MQLDKNILEEVPMCVILDGLTLTTHPKYAKILRVKRLLYGGFV